MVFMSDKFKTKYPGLYARSIEELEAMRLDKTLAPAYRSAVTKTLKIKKGTDPEESFAQKFTRRYGLLGGRMASCESQLQHLLMSFPEPSVWNEEPNRTLKALRHDLTIAKDALMRARRQYPEWYKQSLTNIKAYQPKPEKKGNKNA